LREQARKQVGRRGHRFDIGRQRRVRVGAPPGGGMREEHGEPRGERLADI
jgi:hypothetical protein